MRILRVINSLKTGGAERSIVSNVPVHMLNGYQMDVLLLNGEVTYFFNELQQKGVTIYSLGSGNNIYNPLLIFKLLKYVCRYDIIHVHLFPSIYWVAIAKILSFSRVKLVMTEHSTDNRRRHFAFFIKIIKKLYLFLKQLLLIWIHTLKFAVKL